MQRWGIQYLFTLKTWRPEATSAFTLTGFSIVKILKVRHFFHARIQIGFFQRGSNFEIFFLLFFVCFVFFHPHGYLYRQNFEGKTFIMRGPRKFFYSGSNFENFFFYMWIQIPLKSGHHRSASETPFKWCFAGGPLMTQC